jgi:cytochrome c peroxidase
VGGPDRGRIERVPRVLASEFNADGPFSDAPAGRDARLRALDTDVGRFRTPTIRGVARTAPYTPAGTLARRRT